MHAGIQTYISVYIHAGIHTYISAYIHAYTIHACIHAYIHAHIPSGKALRNVHRSPNIERQRAFSQAASAGLQDAKNQKQMPNERLDRDCVRQCAGKCDFNDGSRAGTQACSNTPLTSILYMS